MGHCDKLSIHLYNVSGIGFSLTGIFLYVFFRKSGREIYLTIRLVLSVIILVLQAFVFIPSRYCFVEYGKKVSKLLKKRLDIPCNVFILLFIATFAAFHIYEYIHFKKLDKPYIGLDVSGILFLIYTILIRVRRPCVYFIEKNYSN